MRKRITSAHVLAVIAIVLAVGGNAFAFTLGKNSVGAKQLKKNAVSTAKIKKEAVTAAKVKKGTLTGAQINLSTLGTVPSAQSAQTALSAQSLPPAEPIHFVGTPGEPPFEAGTSNSGPIFNVTTQHVGFYKDRTGVVHLVGVAKLGLEGALFTLPPGFRPAKGVGEIFSVNEGSVFVLGPGSTNVPVNDGLVFELGISSSSLPLSGITFRAEA